MSVKPKFKPVITRIKLNPEQAVLSCACDTNGRVAGTADRHNGGTFAACHVALPRRADMQGKCVATGTWTDAVRVVTSDISS